MANKYTTHVIRGTLHWAKVLGQPLMNDYAKQRQWSVDVTPNAEGMATLKRLKLQGKMKNKDDARGDFISFRVSEFKKSGEENEPINIVDVEGNPWPSHKKIGNGSIADVKFSYCDYGQTKGSYVKAIRILEHVPYVTQEFAPLDEDDEFFAADDDVEPANMHGQDGEVPEVDDLDDDVPA